MQRCFGLIFLSLLTPLLHGQTDTRRAAGEPIVLAIAKAPAQRLQGFGTSLMTDMQPLPETLTREFSQRVFGDLKMDVVRLWAPSGEQETVETMLETFARRYVNSGRLRLVAEQGVRLNLLAPARGESPPREPMADYARKLAEFILQLKARHQVAIHATGLANEPQEFAPAQLIEGVRVLRAELDQRGLREVGIVAPEFANNDRAALEAIQALLNDPAAFKALRGVATHSYNMAATPAIAAASAAAKKEFWITEAGNTGHEEAGDTQRAASLAARFLNDLNHGVTHWLHFIAYGDSGNLTVDRDNATKLLVYDRKTGATFQSLQYPYLRMLRVAFPTGCQIFPIQAKPGGNLLYSHGQKPELNAAAARLPDGRWTLAAVNLTGLESTPIATYHAAATLHLAFALPANEARLNKTFHLWRSDVSGKIVDAGKVRLSAGKVTLEVAPQELTILLEERG
jgi:hypothetical protein